MRNYRIILLFVLWFCCAGVFGIDRSSVRRVDFSDRYGLDFARGTRYKVVEGYGWEEPRHVRGSVAGLVSIREYRYPQPAKADAGIGAMKTVAPETAWYDSQELDCAEVMDERSGIRSRTFVTPDKQSDGVPAGEPLLPLLLMSCVFIALKMRKL